MTFYEELCMMLDGLTDGIPYRMANLANASALLYEKLTDINWAGFYLMEDEKLILGPFQGKPACIEIPLGKGVCGTAALDDRVLLVEDVHLFAGHIACDAVSNSEIVLPLHKDGKVIGVLDLDSPLYGRFTDEDKEGLLQFAALLETRI